MAEKIDIMNKIKVHYADIRFQDNIPCFEFNNKEEVLEWLQLKVFSSQSIVYLIADEQDVIITENPNLVYDYIEKISNETELFLQEYRSYEMAYKVALNMKEVSELCYEKDLTELN